MGKIKYALISGKFARNIPRSGNEVDLLIVGKIVLPELAQLVRAEEVKRERELNYTVMSEEEFEFRKRRKDPFISGILMRSKVVIVGDEEEIIS